MTMKSSGSVPVTRLAPHGGCNWTGCEECFPIPPVKHGHDIEINSKHGWHTIYLDGKLVASTDEAVHIASLVQTILESTVT